MTQPLGIAVLGATGSIGTQCLEVIAQHPDRFRAAVLTANRNADLLVTLARRFRPEAVAICDPTAYAFVRDALADLPISVHAGTEAVAELAAHPSVDKVLTALVGAAGLLPTLRAIEAGKTLLLANKETLVVAGNLVCRLARKHQVTILPVDSEHSALFQALVGERIEQVSKLIVTASGGPFRGFSREQLQAVTLKEALKHPNWAMGAKITVDSAALINKGLEVIEAHWLFGIPPERIEVVVHPQSIVHSAVEFVDGSVKAQLGTPDMRLPIQYALAYPERIPNAFPRFRFSDFAKLTFESADTTTFRALGLAYQALEAGGNRSCVFNAAAEEANLAFREGRVSFLGMYDVLEHCLACVPETKATDLDALLETDRWTRASALAFLQAFAPIGT